MVDSSLWRESDLVVKVFLTMLAKKDSSHIVTATAYMIGEWSKKTEAEAIEAIKVLSSPDTKRIEPQPYEGRRIEKVPGGWLVLNGQYYEDLMRQVSRKAYKAKKEREYREKRRLALGPTPTERQFDKAYSEGDTQTMDRLTEPKLQPQPKQSPQEHPQI